jgi:ferrous iron transport protein B
LRGLLIHMWAHTREFVQKAGTIILAVSVGLWVLLNLPWGVTDQRASYFGRLSSAVSPVFAPLGFGDWETAGALVTGFAAKEIVVSTLSQIYVGGAGAGATAPATLADDAQLIFGGFAQATLDAGRTLLNIIPGLSFAGAEAEREDTALSLALRQNYSPLAAFALLIFVLLYVPCVATLGAIKHEFGWRWAAASAVYQTGVAWLAAFAVFQGGRLLGLG